MELVVTTLEHDGVPVVAASGELDVHTADQLRDALTRAQKANPALIVIDLEGVQFCDSTGLGVLMGALAAANDQGTAVRLAALQPRLDRLMRLTGLRESFDIRQTREEALTPLS